MDDREPSDGTAVFLESSARTAGREEEPVRMQDPAIRRDGAPQDVPLMEEDRASGFRDRWEECQRSFVDDPRETVESADELVADVMRHLADTFAAERTMLERQWTVGEEVSTEELRVALQRYRS